MDAAILHLPKHYDSWTSPFFTISNADASMSTLIISEATLHNIDVSRFRPPAPNLSLPTYAQITVILDLIVLIKGSKLEFSFCMPCTAECRRKIRKAEVRASCALLGTVSTVYVKGFFFLKGRRRDWYDWVICGWFDTVMGTW